MSMVDTHFIKVPKSLHGVINIPEPIPLTLPLKESPFEDSPDMRIRTIHQAHGFYGEWEKYSACLIGEEFYILEWED